jgi:poly-gamma-glutamate capsule biosynthesis protein CapA/YwtB (metallophosphatase superfamily)
MKSTPRSPEATATRGKIKTFEHTENMLHRLRFIPLLLAFLAGACQPQSAPQLTPGMGTIPPSPLLAQQTPPSLFWHNSPTAPLPDIGTPSTATPDPPAPLTSHPVIRTATTDTGTHDTVSPKTTSLLFTGVIVPARCVQAAIDERGQADYIFDQVREIVTAADLAVGTLNATISDYPPHTGCVPTYVLVGSSGNADALQRAGFDVMSVATNHIKNCGLMDCGDRAFFDTLENLRRVGIVPVGAGADHAEAMQPVVVEVNGVRFGIVSLGQIEPMAFAGQDEPGIAELNPENLHAAIQAARQVSDVVIAMPHWGPEDVPWPNYIQRDLARQLVEAGADLVIGNHTHVVQAMQQINGVPVFYGLGNFVFDQGLRDHQQGAILNVYFEDGRFAGYEFIPTHVDRDGTVHIAEAGEAAEVLERIDRTSQELGWYARPAYIPSITMDAAQGLSQAEVFHQLFEQWLLHYRSEVWSSRDHITAYEIESLSLNESGQYGAAETGVDSTAEVTYSVRPPAQQFSGWAAGSGELTQDGWIRHKNQRVGLRQSGGRYWLLVLGAG